MSSSYRKSLFLAGSPLLSAGLLLASLLLAGCGGVQDKDVEIKSASFEKMLAEKFSSGERIDVREGLEALDANNLQLASQKFNSALIDEPTNAFLHYVNGLTYHLMYRKGDVTKLELAKAGFEQAIKFNPSSVEAHLQLARVKTDEKNYGAAQNDYAAVLLLQPDNVDALYELANASYYLGDLRTAQMGIRRALEKAGNRPEVQRTAVMIYAAAGKSDRAQEHYAQYQKIAGQQSAAERILNRAQDWQKLYEKGIVLAQAENPAGTQEADSAQPDFGSPDAAADSAPAAAPEASKKEANHKKTGEGEMIVIDAVTMRISEVGTTSKGSNILDKFSVTLSPGSHLFTRGNVGTSSTGSAFVGDGTGVLGAVQGTAQGIGSTRLFAQGLTFAAIKYSLNIANATRQYIEVIGRPSLVASIGSPQPAKFFSGDHLTLGLAPSTGGGGGSIQRLPVGVTLEVNPLSLEDGFVVLDVTIYGSIVNANDLVATNGSAINPTQQFTRIGLSKIQTRVKVKLGETVMLGGITERLENQNKDGVPWLQDIPLVQYLFSTEATSSTQKSVVYMLTPRSYESNRHAIKTMARLEKQPNLKELEMRNLDWYDPDYNFVITLKHLAPLHREFRHGDLPPLLWDMNKDYQKQVAQASSFLYF